MVIMTIRSMSVDQIRTIRTNWFSHVWHQHANTSIHISPQFFSYKFLLPFPSPPSKPGAPKIHYKKHHQGQSLPQIYSNMCGDVYVQYSCGCLGRKLGFQQCRFAFANDALMAAPPPTSKNKEAYDRAVCDNMWLCEEEPDMLFQRVERLCRECAAVEKERREREERRRTAIWRGQGSAGGSDN